MAIITLQFCQLYWSSSFCVSLTQTQSTCIHEFPSQTYPKCFFLCCDSISICIQHAGRTVEKIPARKPDTAFCRFFFYHWTAIFSLFKTCPFESLLTISTIGRITIFINKGLPSFVFSFSFIAYLFFVFVSTKGTYCSLKTFLKIIINQFRKLCSICILYNWNMPRYKN